MNIAFDSKLHVLPARRPAGFYITNGNNVVSNNAASGGWAGFVLVELPRPIKMHRNLLLTPSSRPLRLFDGNTAHSSGFWWLNAGMMYVGGKLFHPNSSSDILIYSPGRVNPARDTCDTEPCSLNVHCRCQADRRATMRMSNIKLFASRGTGMLHWGQRVEITSFEVHDVGLSLSFLGKGYVHHGLVRCRTGSTLQFQCNNCNEQEVLAQGMSGRGFEWYDTGQAHILTNITFRRCGVDVNDGSNGCGDGQRGCGKLSSVWSFLTFSDEHVPESMQATAGIKYDECGLRFRFSNFLTDHGGQMSNGMQSSVSERLQNWLDKDGSASGSGFPTILGSASAGQWWRLDESCRLRGPLKSCPTNDRRHIGSIHLSFSGTERIGSQFGEACANGVPNVPCVPVGVVKHWGAMYSADVANALPLTMNPEITGALDGFGWHAKFFEGQTPARLTIGRQQVSHDAVLLLSIAYPTNTSIRTVYATAPAWCLPWENENRKCTETFTEVNSIAAVRASAGNVYHFSDSILILRVVQPPGDRTGSPLWQVEPDAIKPFERDGIRITGINWNVVVHIEVNCKRSAHNDDMCAGEAVSNEPPACTHEYPTQAGYDMCCNDDGSTCIDPEGLPSSQPPPPPLQPPPDGGSCESWCTSHPSPWGQKCEWSTRACAACSQCIARCESWCTSHPSPWVQKCEWSTRACATCSQCPANS